MYAHFRNGPKGNPEACLTSSGTRQHLSSPHLLNDKVTAARDIGQHGSHVTKLSISNFPKMHNALSDIATILKYLPLLLDNLL